MEAPGSIIQATVPSSLDRIDIKALARLELEAFVVDLGLNAYRGRQLFAWLYGKGASSFEEMTDLPLDFRERLESIAYISRIEPARVQTSSDQTVKVLFALSSGRQVETVLIPDLTSAGSANRLTVCVSSQVGCAMGCSFCATGTMGFRQNLTCGEIYDQAFFMNRLAQERFGRAITNIVFMGMGEPLLNYDAVMRSIECMTHPDGLGMAARRITLSTVGLARRIRQLAEEDRGINLAVSLHAPTDEKRSSIMPVNRAAATDLTALRDAIEYFVSTTGRRITYEYCMFQGFNDAKEDALRLADVVGWAPSKVNLIMYNPVDGLGFERTPEEQLEKFIRILVERGVIVTVRRSRGQDIAAACGQLAVEEEG